MKTLSYLVAGLITAGSLGIFGGKSYGQEETFKEIPELTVKASLVNHQEYQIEYLREFGDGEMVLNKYFDTNRDGKIDSFSVFSYSPEDNQISKMNTNTFGPMEALYPDWVKKNLPLGKTYYNCEKGYFKENLEDYIKK